MCVSIVLLFVIIYFVKISDKLILIVLNTDKFITYRSNLSFPSKVSLFTAGLSNSLSITLSESNRICCFDIILGNIFHEHLNMLPRFIRVYIENYYVYLFILLQKSYCAVRLNFESLRTILS